MRWVLSLLFKVIITLLVIGLVLGVGIFGLRYYNTQKYKPESDVTQDEFSDPTNLSLYDMDIPNVDVNRIEGDYINGFHLKPMEKKYKGVVITFGGSEGSPNYGVASRLAESGYETISLFYFGMENQQKELFMIPLEFFDEVLEYIDGNIEDDNIITLLGISKGAELSLNLAIRYDEIDNLILFAPSEYNYMGLSYTSRDMHSSWTWKGEELPYIDMTKGDILSGIKMAISIATKSPVAYRSVYESAAKGDPNREQARIKIEETDANILLISGTDDLVWQSDIAANNLYAKRPENTYNLQYEGAGHVFFQDRYLYSDFMVMASGGDKKTNEEAGYESNEIMMSLLEEWHSK